jgi:hypothetical protein
MLIALTQAQWATLALIRDGKVRQRRYGGAAWRIDGATPQAVGRLVALKLARWAKVTGDEQPCELTQAGINHFPAPTV